VNVSLVLTVIGPDRPGLVESLSQAIAQQEGNWLESRMARMAGQFAGILRVNIEEERAEEGDPHQCRNQHCRGLRIRAAPAYLGFGRQ